MRDRICEIEPSRRESLAQDLASLRHDLGKYIVFLSRHAPAASLRETLRDDLLATRRGSSGSVSAPALWQSLSQPLRDDLRGDSDFDAIDEAMAEIARGLPDLQSGAARDEDLSRLALLAREVSGRCDSLWRRARSRA